MRLLKDGFREEKSCIGVDQCPVHADRVKSSTLPTATVSSNAVTSCGSESQLKQETVTAASPSSARPSKKLLRAGLSDSLS